jgi:hypothetical protein
MTAPRDPDDLASALLDGLLTDDEATVARRDPAVAARLVELAAVREAVGLPPPGPDPAARERGLTAALAAYDAADGADEQDSGDESGGAPVSPLGPARAAARPATSRGATPWRPQGTARRRWLTAAAVILVVVGFGVLARNLGTGSDDTETGAQSGGDESSSEGGAPDAAAEEPDSGSAERGAPSAGAGVIVDLGGVDSSESLADRARSALAERFASPLAEASEDDDAGDEGASDGLLLPQCGDAANAEDLSASSETVVLQARATLDGEPVDVWVLASDGKERVVAVDASCAVVVDQPLQD